MSRWDWTELVADTVTADMIKVPRLDQDYERPVHLSDAGQVDRLKSTFSAIAAYGGALGGPMDGSRVALSTTTAPVGPIAGHTLRAILETGAETLEPGRPLGDMPADRWVQLLNDTRWFLDRGFAEQAGDLGWSTVDLVGCDPLRPYARIDRAGLVLLLNGHRLTLLAEDHAAIESGRKDTTTTFRRRHDPVRPLIWQLVCLPARE